MKNFPHELCLFYFCFRKVQTFDLMGWIYRLLIVIFALTATISCTNNDIFDGFETEQTPFDPVEEGQTELRLSAPMTRATVDASLNLRWERGDRITLMAYDGTTQIFSKTASFWANQTSPSTVGSQAYFKIKFDTNAEADVLSQVENMADGKCYAVSPVNGVTINGTTVTMNIPARQTGEYNAGLDLMTARSGSISKLKLCDGKTTSYPYNPEESKYINDIDLVFKHHTHAFKVTIPNNNLGKAITKAYVRFPFAVVGDLSVDYTTGAVTAVNNTANLIEVVFTKPKTAGDEFWVFINGVENKGKVDIRFQAADGTFTERRVANFTQQNWTAGAVSKVNMSIPQAVTYTTIQCDVQNYSQLGEPVTHLHFSLAEDYYFTDYTTSCSTTVNASNNYLTDKNFVFFSDLIDSSFRAAQHSLTFESANAIVPNPDPIVFGDGLRAGAFNAYSLAAPYLFEEDFSGISTFDYELNKNTGVVTATALDSYGLTGWFGARVGVSNGAVAIGVRHETVAQYRGRLDTSGITTLKDGKKVNIQVKFHANRSNDYAYIDCGIGMVTDGALDGGADHSVASTRIDPATNTSITYTNIATTDYTCNFSNITRDNRVSWKVSRDYNFTGNGWVSRSWYVYMDNIRVSIAQ